MKPQFDPYLDWLQIPAPQRPPNHYQLLGLSPQESDPQRIELAAMERIAFVRRYQVGTHEQLAQQLLSELSAAYVCLSDPQRKRQYDLSLTSTAASEPLMEALPLGASSPSETPVADAAAIVPTDVVAARGKLPPRSVTAEVQPLQPRAAARSVQPAALDQSAAQTVWAVEAGSSSLKAMRLKLSEATGAVAVLAAEQFEYVRPICEGEQHAAELIGQAIERWQAKYLIEDEPVAVVVPTSAALIRAVRLPPVLPQRIASAVRIAALSQFPIHELSWDYYVSPAVVENSARDVVLVAERRDRLRLELVPWLERGIEPDLIQIKTVAWFNFARRELFSHLPPTPRQEATESLAIISLAAQCGELLVTDGYHFCQYELPIGGNHFTAALAEGFKIPFAKAEQRKRALASSAELRESLKLLKPAFQQLLDHVQRGLALYTTAHPAARLQRLVPGGGAMQLPGLQRYLAEKLRLEIQPIPAWQQARDLSGSPALAAHQAFDRFAACYAAGCQVLGKTAATLELVPRELAQARHRRRQNARRMVAVAAVAAAAVLSLLAYGIMSMDRPDRSSSAPMPPSAESVVENVDETAQDDAIASQSDAPTPAAMANVPPPMPIVEATLAEPSGSDKTQASTAPAASPPPERPNRPPTVQVLSVQPSAPVAGEEVRIELSSSDPDGDRIQYQYRRHSESSWQAAPQGIVQLPELPAGDLTLEFRVVDERKLESELCSKTIAVESNPLVDWRRVASLGPGNTAVHSLHFRNAGTLILGLANGKSEFWSIGDAMQQKVFSGSHGSVAQTAFIGDERNLLTMYNSGTIESWLVGTEKSQGWQNPSYVGSSFRFGFGSFNSVLPTATSQPAGAPYAMLAPNGLRAVYCVGGMRLQWYQIPSTGRMKLHLQAKDLPAAATALQFSRDSRYLAVALADGQIVVYENAKLNEVARFRVGGSVTALAFCVSDRLLACGAQNGAISVWQFDDESRRVSIEQNQSRVECLAFPASSAGFLVSGTADGCVTCWRGGDGHRLKSFQLEKGRVTCLASLPGGELVAAGGESGKAYVFGPNTP
jgi:type IV pilus assembly protein PilM